MGVSWIAMGVFPMLLAAGLYIQPVSEQEWLTRLQALCVLDDHRFSLEASKEALSAFPNSKELYIQSIQLYALAGNEGEMLRCFREFQTHFPQDAYPRDLLENMSWGIIQNGIQSPSAQTRAIAAIAAALGNDSRGVRLLAKCMHDPNRLVRILAVEFASRIQGCLFTG